MRLERGWPNVLGLNAPRKPVLPEAVDPAKTAPIRSLARSSEPRILSYDGVQLVWKTVVAFLP